MSSGTAESPQLAFSEIRMEAFRRLTGVTLSNLHRLNLIVSDNNIGKTSVLEALLLLCRGLSLQTLRELQELRVSGAFSREEVAEATYWLGAIDPDTRTSTVRMEGVRAAMPVNIVRFKCTRRSLQGMELESMMGQKGTGEFVAGRGPFS
jgi:hypothetical protein